jgi:hypothetical protein
VVTTELEQLRADVAELEAASGRKKIPWVLPRHKPAFTLHASPEAIEAHLKARRRDRHQLDLHIAWLEELHAARLLQVSVGQWPAKEEGS